MSASNALQWLAAEAVPPEPWRNGGGSTRTLFVWPDASTAADWRLRISLADIARDGPFSPFAGVQRWFTVVQGPGVTLHWPGRDRALTPASAPLPFDGADAPGCTLIDGPTRDLNLMLRGVAGGMLMAQPVEPWSTLAGAWRACFSTGAGRLQAGDQTIDWSAMGLVLVAGAATAEPWRWAPQAPDARAWWLWADLTEQQATAP